MSSFPSDLLRVLNELHTRPVITNTAGPFPIYKPEGTNIVIQAIELEKYVQVAPERDFFKNQSNQYEEDGCLILHCWEDVWLRKPVLVISRLSALFGQAKPVHGRKCIVKEISTVRMNQFLEQNHLLGSASGKYSYGLFHQENLVAIALFGRSVPIQRSGITFKSYEMIRFCNERDIYVQGGLTKLIHHFIKSVNPEEIYTVIDRDWSDGKGYISVGFKRLGTTEPRSFWLLKSGERVNSLQEDQALEVVNSGNIRMVLNLKSAVSN